MQIKLHQKAATTPAIRKAIQTSQLSVRELAEQYGVSLDTIYKWKSRDDVFDRSHARHNLLSSLSDNFEWSDRCAGGVKEKATDLHSVDQLCAKLGIEHRLTRIRRPQTNGMVERFNLRISQSLERKEKIKDNSGRNCFPSHKERNAFIRQFVFNYNRTRQNCLNQRAPLQLMHSHHPKDDMKKINKRLLFALMVVLCMLGAPAWADDVGVLCAKHIKDKDYKKAFVPCKQAVEQGDARAQNNLGWMYFYGEGVGQNKREAAKWYRLAAEQGYANAQNNLGWMYFYGEGVQQDKQEAAKWYRLAAEQGNAGAQNNLGWMYFYGEGVGQNKREAIKWYRLAAEQGNATAQNDLGVMYDNGEGVQQDKREAAKWYRKAAGQGYAEAQFNLGLMYENGEGVQQDKREAVKWYRLAAEQGEASAQFNLGVMYYNGEGVIQNHKEAYIWFSLSATGGDEDAKENRDIVAQDISASEIRQAKKEAERRLATTESKDNTTETFGTLELRQPAINPAATAFENGWRSVVVIKTTESQGSGVIIRPNLVATNCHVIDDGEDITVYKADNRRAQTDSAHYAKIYKRDEERDLCLLDVKGLWGIPANIRRADTLNVGENVYAIGAPSGLEYSMSAGIVSQLRGDGGEAPIIQTDTAMSPGSSGGGFFDGEGNLVGITTIKFVDEDIEGISFAIPADWILELR